MKNLSYFISFLVLIFTNISCNESSTNSDQSQSSSNESGKITINSLDYTFTKDLSISNFKFANSFIKQSVLKDGNDEVFLQFTFDIISNNDNIFEKRISIEKAKEIGLSAELFRIEANNQLDDMTIFAHVIFKDINGIENKNEYFQEIITIYDENNQSVDFNSMSPMLKGKLYHATGHLKFSNMQKTSTDYNIDFLKKEIAFKPEIFIEINGGIKSDFGKYHQALIDSKIDISNLKKFGTDAISSNKNFIKMENNKWFLSDFDVSYKYLNIKK